jgi:2-methylisocitrate lyase-like PEP mutase family enzyme
MTSLKDRHKAFFAMHQSGCFVIPNPWDAGSARVMAAFGARALATTSAGFAFTLGRADMGHVGRDEALAHAEAIVAATPLPVSGDFENGFFDEPDEVAETVRLAREAGLSGCSIEDTRMEGNHPAYVFDFAVERVAAAVDAARSLQDPFILCARADGILTGSYDLDEGLRRIKAFAGAGADVVYIPLLPGIDALKTVTDSVSAPVNALAAGALVKYSVRELAEAGARRISVGSMLARITHAALRDSARSLLVDGSFATFTDAAPGKEIDELLRQGGDDG